MSEYRTASLKEDPLLLPGVKQVIRSAWPDFMLHDPIADRYWGGLYQLLPEFQIAVTSSQSGEVVAAVNAAPISWDGPITSLPDNGWDWALENAILGAQTNTVANCLCGLSVSIEPQYRGKGLSGFLTDLMREKANEYSFRHLVVPVRPSLKSRYPLTEMDHYVRWLNRDGLPFDPWLRVHIRHGAERLNVCTQSMEIGGSISDWEGWTQMTIPESGAYIIPDALVPLRVDYDNDRAVYVEPNVWVRYSIE